MHVLGLVGRAAAATAVALDFDLGIAVLWGSHVVVVVDDDDDDDNGGGVEGDAMCVGVGGFVFSANEETKEKEGRKGTVQYLPNRAKSLLLGF